MKNKKGFTLVEILAVIVILSVVVIIAFPSIQNALSSSKHGLSELEKGTIKDSAETIILEVINCDIDENVYNVLKIPNTKTCSEVNDLVVGKTIRIYVEDMRTYGFITDVSERCSGTVKIKTNASNYQVTVNTSGITCS